MDDKKTEHIVMTPKCKTANSTTLIIERQALEPPTENGNENNVHIAGGDHKGIVINKQAVAVTNGEIHPAHLCLQFRVFLVSAQSGKHTQESRTLQFWFVDTLSEAEHPSVAQEFFRELVTPQEFPRDYVGFIKKIMKLMLHKYSTIKKIEVELKQLEEPVNLPTRPSDTGHILFTVLPYKKISWKSVSTDETVIGQVVELTLEKVLELIESAYPNPITVTDIAKEHGWDPSAVEIKLKELQEKGVVKAMEHGAFTRVVHQDTQIQVVKQMPTMASAKQPTIAIITAQYCEKLAVDSMIENKETFVRYTTVGTASSPDATDGVPRVTCRFGESNVYTLGNIGAHRIVCTKLPTVGHTREAMTAAGNTTTRLLGTFQKVDFVFLIGIGGGVPHYTDYNKHVRLGDVVISYPIPLNKKYIYVYCESAKTNESGDYHFETKEYCPPNLCLQEIAVNLKDQSENETNPPWQTYLKEGSDILTNQTEHDFKPPPPESDKLYMAIGERDVIEVAHPTAPADAANKRTNGCPRIHLAPVASGRHIARDDQLRQKFAARFGALAFDAEMDAVVESILGNCRESFAVIRGISDYKDGSRIKEWQPYASLAAASVMKSIICAMDPPTNV
ncbi:uncharacterized protein LOC100749615 isoform X1 [Bombus impatiens]|uniref:Uncharacterized protein LOC117211761 isoform X1 n=2 Tax=Pyrobombus TaxID=144703 RepID=A0A6P8MDI8_9HYME|nr:uncharacterized protein LOC100749615 isoform X1 [Bombus impatiens]XP_033197056.1 uncharacterized protein LOC117160443 isoform X1 [Bombus vancouverensis nearcticus]XP_033197057.1 uncharacterized protein LOC117160443 isoform X1 [Bombus vancouverensis nearcticus]XP_033311869.1 uncharacterized protein LOC117211761 isoform X1 [Bombus bifarius]XP_033311871.1 uncharacterized protein LOC117211761 isoform X1 [Bombus bifarius]